MLPARISRPFSFYKIGLPPVLARPFVGLEVAHLCQLKPGS